MGNKDFDEIIVDESENTILILRENKSPLYIENFQNGLIERGFGKVIRDIIVEDGRHIYFNKNPLEENEISYHSDRRSF